MNLLVDILTDDELVRLRGLVEYQEIFFNELVNIAGLDPSTDFKYCNLRFVDFRRADLRGFDFTGSDLRYSTKDSNTIVDETTVFSETLLEWLEPDEVPIVEVMLEAQAATNSESRRRALRKLIDQPASSSHINKYLVSSVKNSGTLDAAIDFADHLIGDIPPYLEDELRASMASIIEGKASKTRARSRRLGLEKLSVNAVVERIGNARSKFLRNYYSDLANYALSKAENQTGSARSHLELSMAELVSALRAKRRVSRKRA